MFILVTFVDKKRALYFFSFCIETTKKVDNDIYLFEMR